MQGRRAEPELQPLTERQQRFVTSYAETGNRVMAWLAAGYSGVIGNEFNASARCRCSTMVHKPHIQRAIDHAKTELVRRKADDVQFTLDWLRAEHIRLAKAAEAEGDLTNSTRNLEAVGRTMGAYSDTLSLSTDRLRTYTESEQAEARRMAGLLLAQDQTSAGPDPVPDMPPREQDESDADAVPGADQEPGQAQDQAGADQAQTGDAPQPAQDQDTATPQAGPGAVMQDPLPHLSGSVTVLDRSETMHGYAQQQDKAVLVGLASV